MSPEVPLFWERKSPTESDLALERLLRLWAGRSSPALSVTVIFAVVSIEVVVSGVFCMGGVVKVEVECGQGVVCPVQYVVVSGL